MFLNQRAIQLCLPVALLSQAFLSRQRGRARDPLILERILHLWAHYMEKGTENLTSSGPLWVEVPRSDFITDPGAFATAGGVLVSSSQGY
jgi:hypothetical protein